MFVREALQYVISLIRFVLHDKNCAMTINNQCPSKFIRKKKSEDVTYRKLAPIANPQVPNYTQAYTDLFVADRHPVSLPKEW